MVSLSVPPSSPALTSPVPGPRTTGVDELPASEAAAPKPGELLAFVQAVAADRELIASLPLDPDGRTWVRLEGPSGSEAWLIGWPPGAETGWHDHGGSFGAFATAAGDLREESAAVPVPPQGRRTVDLGEGAYRVRELPTGKGRFFGEHHVHQVVNLSGEHHSVSVHAYYPPLPLMRRYSRHGNTLRFELVERPEAW